MFYAKTIFFEISTDSEDEQEEGAIKLNNDVWGDSDKEFYAGLRYVLSVYC